MRCANPLHAYMTSLGEPYGYERSCKFSNALINDKRFLLTQHKSLLKGQADSLIRFAGSLGMSSDKAAWIAGKLPSAELFHLGFEPEEGSPRYKIYFEYPLNELMLSSGEAILLHEAIKWRPNSQAVITQYHLMPPQTHQQLVASVKEHLNDSELAQSIIEWLVKCGHSEEIMMLEVSESSTGRRSFDLNVYDLDLKLSSLDGLIMPLSYFFQIPLDHLKCFFTDNSEASLGHIAGGMARDGQPFLTLYFAVEERACG